MLKKFIALFAFSLFLLPALALPQGKDQVSILLYNGKIFTSDEGGSFAEAVAIDKDRIVAVGPTRDLRAKYNGVQQIDLGGKLVTPGFNDAHIHFGSVGLALLRVDLNGSRTLEEAKRRIAAKIKELPKGAWVLGRGWDHTLWGNRLPTKEDLDEVAPDNPVFVQRVDGHISWSNSLAFELANLTRNSNAPTGGEIVRNPDGEPAGVLKETAQELVRRAVPATTVEERKKGLQLAIEQAKTFGLTSVQTGGDFGAVPIFRQLLDAGELTVRVAVWQDFENELSILEKQREDFRALSLDQNRLKIGILKGYMDGTLGSRTAAMIEPFSDDPGNKGIPRMPAEQMIKMIVERDAAGFQIGLHAIGDQANRTALEGFRLANENDLPCSLADLTPVVVKVSGNPGCVSKRRNRIEHAQIIHPADFKKFADLGIIASMQPTHAITDKRWAPDRLGDYRTLGSYAWNTFRSYRVRVAFGTDAPVEPLNTYLTLYAAVTRKAEQGEPGPGWMPQEKLTMDEAIRAYTYESAFAEFAENEKGMIKPGMLADLVVHSKDLFTIEPMEILKTRPVYTIFDGKIVYNADGNS